MLADRITLTRAHIAVPPPTIQTTDGLEWTYEKQPFEGEFVRRYRCGQRVANLTSHRGSELVRFVTATGKRLDVERVAEGEVAA
ncbi:hypothetical protein [Deinococcus hopiensis]|uniref:Uncharacterized protein n=1 Tax=Deinococcus hopiensis KR-140 TaxID=695939 RepID=A0A1W1VJ34_9DEIO|nr:hypothetical protein [Deinococcus hopiensis]SMB93389.1 hypothetical protein SAMN00790413_01962 [Deinococcus hopiensis KR-140]